MMKRNATLITSLSLFACLVHGAMLYTPFNDYFHTSAVKFALFMICPVIYLAISKDYRLKDLFFLTGNAKSIKYSFLFGVIVFIAVFIGFLIVRPWLDYSMIIGAMSNVGITKENYIFIALYYVVVNVALEELFFRGFIFLTLYKIGYKYYAHIYSSLLFAIYHVAIMRYGVSPGLLLLSTLGLIAVGLLFNEITRRCNNVIGSYAVHTCASLAISIIGFHLMQQ